MSVAVALLHFSESASEIRQAVNLVVDSTARSFGEHSLMMLSSWSVDKTRACPHPPLFGIYLEATTYQTIYVVRLVDEVEKSGSQNTVLSVFKHTCFLIGDMSHTRTATASSCFDSRGYDRYPAAVVCAGRATCQTAADHG